MRERFPPGPSLLHRYAAAFPAVEINSSFHRPHRPATYARWASSVPDRFRFSVKLPRAVTHEARLAGTAALVERFLGEVRSLGDRLGVLLDWTSAYFGNRAAARLDIGPTVTPAPDAPGVAADVERAFTLFPRLKERRKQIAGTLSGGEQ